MDKENLSGRDEPIRTGRTFSERRPAGKIYAVDPKAVARLKAYVSEKEKQRTSTSKPEQGDIVSNLMRTQYRRQAVLNARRRKPEIPAELARQWHITFYQAGLSIAEVSEHFGVSRQRVTRRWRELGLPISRKVKERSWQPVEEEDESQG